MDKCEFIYLDHAAATPMDERVLRAMQPYFSELFFNPSSPYLPAVKVRQDYENAKHQLAQLIGARPAEIVITAGATESINIAFSAVEGGHVITTEIEHTAVIESAKRYDHTLVKVDKYGRVAPNEVLKAIMPNTRLVSIALANNEIGTIQPIREIAAIVHAERDRRLEMGEETPIFFHCDASQGAGQVDVNVSRLGVDMLTLNAAKIYGPKQVGLLYVASHVKLTPYLAGGGQELGLRSGTENVAGVIGFAKALELAHDHYKSESERLEVLGIKLRSSIETKIPEAIFSGHPKHHLNSYVHVSFPGIDGERLVFLLEKNGVLVATGSACAANKGSRSHVLTAIGLSGEVADGSIRMTLGRLNDEAAIEQAAGLIIEAVKGEYQRTGHK